MTLAQTPTEVASDTRAARPSAAARKVAAAAAALFAVALFMTVASVDVPHDPTDSELAPVVAAAGQPHVGTCFGDLRDLRGRRARRRHELPAAARCDGAGAAMDGVRPVDGGRSLCRLACHGCGSRCGRPTSSTSWASRCRASTCSGSRRL